MNSSLAASLFLTLGIAVSIGCEKAETRPPAAEEAASGVTRQPAPSATSQPAPSAASQPSKPSSAAIARRVASSQTRLRSTDAGKLLLKSIKAHGGLSAWFKLEGLKFRYRYAPVGKPEAVRDSVQTIELFSARALHEITSPVQGQFAWDGTQAWTDFGDGQKFAARFWALTPYYFVGLPFVLADPGVVIKPSTAKGADVGLPNTTAIEIAFKQGVGDAPNDTYRLYIDDATARVRAVRYTVTYTPFFAGKKTKHSPYKLLVFSGEQSVGEQSVGEVALAKEHTFFALTTAPGNGPETRGNKVTDAVASEVEAVAIASGLFSMPTGAKIDRSLD